MVTLAVLGGVLFCFTLGARRVAGTVITAPMVFVSAGLVAGWASLVDFGSAAHGEAASEATHEVVLVVAELALVRLLFTDAARIDVRAPARERAPGAAALHRIAAHDRFGHRGRGRAAQRP